MNDYSKPDIQLAGDDHDRAQNALSDVDGSLKDLAELVLDTVFGASRNRGAQVKALVTLDNSKFVISDGESCGVYEEPPGICRECTPQEVTDVSHAGGT